MFDKRILKTKTFWGTVGLAIFHAVSGPAGLAPEVIQVVNALFTVLLGASVREAILKSAPEVEKVEETGGK